MPSECEEFPDVVTPLWNGLPSISFGLVLPTSDLKPFAFDVTQTALLLFSPSPGGRIRALGRSRNARQSDLRQIKRKPL